jgi:hypothetical protein
LVSRSHDAARVLFASVIVPKANFSSSPGRLPALSVTVSSVTKTVFRTQTATGFPAASFWVSTALS